MTTSLLGAADRALARLDRAGAVLGRAAVSGHAEVLDLLPTLVQGDWAAVGRHAEARLPVLDEQLAQWDGWRAAATTAREAAAALAAADSAPAADRPGWPALRAALVTELRARGRSPAEASAIADRLGQRSVADVAAPVLAAVRAGTAGLEPTGESLADARHALLLLHVVAAFHAVPATRGRVAMRPVAAAAAALDTAEERFWSAVQGGQLQPAGGALAEAAEAEVDAVVTVAARLAAARSRRPTDLLDEAVRTGDVLRRALHLAAAGRAAQVASDPERWERAAGLPVTGLQDPALTAAPPPVDGVRATLLGVLEDVTLTHRGPMAVSTGRFRVGGEVVTLLSTHIKLDSGGFVPGAAAVVGGRWMTDHPDAGGPALFVRREPVAEMAARDRRAWLLHRTRYVYVPVPHRMVVRASVEPGRGVAGPLVYGTFAAETRSL